MATQAMPQGGLFGPSLDEYTQAQTQRDDQAAINFAGMDDNQRNSYLMYKAGGMLMKPIMGALGYENTAESRIKKVQDISSKYDTTTADGLMQTAKAFNDAGMAREAQIALAKAREMQAAASKLTYEDAKTQRELAVAERALREQKSNEFPNLPPEVQAMMMLEKLPPESGAAKNIRAWLDTKAKGKGEWSDPYELGGATVQKNLATGEIRTAVSRPPVTRVSVGGRGGDGGDITPPKNLTREARLKWELDNGFIDQATYDASISSTPGGVLRQKQQDAVSTAKIGFESVERNINQLFDQKTGKLKPAAESLFGQYSQYRPEITLSQESVDAKLALEGLTDQVMMANLADAKARVGQSFGSMQVQEWDKFTQQLTSLKRGLSPDQAASSMKYVSDFIKNKRNVLDVAMSKPNSISPAQPKQKSTPQEFNARWATLKSGQSMIGPDGKTYTKK